MNIYPSLQFNSTGQPVCFYAIPVCFHYCSSKTDLDVKDGDASGSSYIVQDCFGYCRFFFPYEVEYCPFKFCEELCWDFDRNCSAAIDCFDRIVIFIMLILPIQEHGRSFHFSGIFFNFFVQRLNVLVKQIFQFFA